MNPLFFLGRNGKWYDLFDEGVTKSVRELIYMLWIIPILNKTSTLRGTSTFDTDTKG